MNIRTRFKPALALGVVIIGLGTMHSARTRADGRELRVLDAGSSMTQSQSSSGPYQGGTRYIGTLQFTGDHDYQPNGSYYYSSTFGFHKGCLIGPEFADFDLHLQKWNGSAWVIVASSMGATSIETISTLGSAGYYRWQIYSYNG